MADGVFATGQRWQVRGEPTLVGYIARDQEGVGPGMVRMKNLIDVKKTGRAGREVHRSALVETRLLEVWNG